VAHDAIDSRIDAMRRFSRFYTRTIGVLHEGLLGSDLSLAEGRVVFEIATRSRTTATALGLDLGLDAGYLSRILKGLDDRGLVERHASPTDGRQSDLQLTRAGRTAFEAINARSRHEVGQLLGKLSVRAQRDVVAAMATIEKAMAGSQAHPSDIVLRPHRPGDMGWVVHRHGVLYAAEYGWDETFEAVVAEVAGSFIKNFKPARERCWIAERDGEILGSAFVVEKSRTIAKLRLVYVEPHVRGHGLGRRLVEAAMDFARAAGYRRMTLWTNDVLLPARRLYDALGFKQTASEPYHGFGKDLVGETWEQDLKTP
jgi:DNA-binding MarR family transcriptional regulator/GNAT superfamily N-acetyltransferase